MEELLFYDYLNYQKAQRVPLRKRILKLPKIPLFICLLSVVSILVAIIALVCNAQIVAIFAVIAGVFGSFVLEYTLERSRIKNSKDRITMLYASCLELKAWLIRRNYIKNEIQNEKEIHELKSRIEKRITTYKKEQKEFVGRIDKWLQILVVPITIIAITCVINKSFSIAEKTSHILTILLVFGIIYGFISVMKNASRFIQKRKTEQMVCFAEDLQAILDLDTINRIST